MHQTPLVTIALVALIGLLAVQPAFAQGDSEADRDARVHFDQGRAAYDDGRFEDAVRSFRRAYVLSPRYPLLYNIGQAELRAGHDDRALQAFEGYLRQAPQDARERSEVQERASVLRSLGVTPSVGPEIAGPAQATTDAPAPAPSDPSDAPAASSPSSSSSSSGGDAAPWIVLGVGGAVLVAGAIMMGVGASEAQRVTDAPIGSRWPDLQGAASTADTLWGVGIGAAALGLAAVGVGLVWGLTSSSGSESARSPETSARVRVGLGSASIEGNF